MNISALQKKTINTSALGSDNSIPTSISSGSNTNKGNALSFFSFRPSPLNPIGKSVKTGKLLEVTKEIGQSIARSFLGASQALTEYNKDKALRLLGREKDISTTPVLKRTFNPESTLEKSLFGENPVSIETIGQETLAIGGEGFKNKYNKFAVPLGLIISALDIIPVGNGGGRVFTKTIKKIAKTDDVAEIAKLLKTITLNASDDKIGFLSKTLKYINKEKDVKVLLELASNAKKINKSALLRLSEKRLLSEFNPLKVTTKDVLLKDKAISSIYKRSGNSKKIIKRLESLGASTEEIGKIKLEDGTRLIDTLKIKRNADHSLASIVKKSEISDLKKSYRGVKTRKRWEVSNKLTDTISNIKSTVHGIELPQLYFERKGLSKLWDRVVEAGRAAEAQKTSFIQRFKDSGLFKEGLWTKEGGWITSARFTLTKKQANNIGKYYLSRQGKYPFKLPKLGKKEKDFIKIFDEIIKETEPRFFEVAKKLGKNPRKVSRYAPIATKKELKLIDKEGAREWLFRKHPAFSSVKKRTAKKIPISYYETDYRKIASHWLSGITDFINIGEESQDLKYLLDSKEFKKIVTKEDYSIISKWLRDVTTEEQFATTSSKSIASMSKLLRKGIAIGTLGLNYATVLKQALTQIPIAIIDKSLPKFHSAYAKAFGIDTKLLPSITKRAGDIAISDLQGKIGRIFTGGITRFDKKNAQIALNGLLDKGYRKFLKEGIEITPEVRKTIEKTAQDQIDLWFGGFFKGQRPEYFRKEVGNFVLMFLYPLTSQLNGFFRNILRARGIVGRSKAIAETLTAATAIAYSEQVIENLSFKWSDKTEMTKDVTQSLVGNIPLVSQIGYSLMTEQPLAGSPVISSLSNILKNIAKAKSSGDWTKPLFSGLETVGVPKQLRKIKEGMEIIEQGGIRDKNGKMLAPVSETSEIIRSILRGKYGSIASKDWIRNIGKSQKNRSWFVPQVEFLQNGDYNRKAQLYQSFNKQEQSELRSFLSDTQQKKLDIVIKKRHSLDAIFKHTNL